MSKRRPWTPEDRRTLVVMRQQGMPLRAVAAVLERPLSAVKKYCHNLMIKTCPSLRPPEGVIPHGDRDLRLIPGQIDADDLEWMRHYRNQARARQRALTEAQQALREGKTP